MATVNDQGRLLEARIRDVAERCTKGIPATLPFLTPGEQRAAERQLRAMGLWQSAYLFGGYAGAERRSLFLLPEYLTACLSAPPMECEPEEVQGLLQEELRASLAAIRISGSGFRTLTHRDYLGAILHLGLERDALGDLAVQNDREAVLFCAPTVAAFLMETLDRVANDGVRCIPYTPDQGFTDGRRYQPMSVTVASLRLDCVVAALCDLSREAAQSAVRTGLVEVDFEEENRPDLSLTPPVTLSVRGKGRFLLRRLHGETRKGRLRLLADKMV